MELWQNDILIGYTISALIFAIKGWYESAIKRNPYGQQTFWINLYGAFVWADAAILCAFWFFAGIATLYLQDWLLFLLLQSVFWFIRSLGETLYWFLTQFTNLNKDPAEKFYLNKFFPGGAVHFVNQMFWQCVSVITLILSIYFAKLWLQ
jgi:hypothetical protein